ncbi:HD domain-containing protein [Rossellomorea vietnamensis]|uniref:5'-deoxynucleotidase n=1 Tax=Rossellomorea vietnamensis TaxID=218284 RepID=A0A5D4MFQ9_9BACI|nr:HD domain-containing protein [Rossellomorea vietnamensis]TYS00338.1 HD domain-containing protein [Rossellomorea vietnamensis]
MRTELSKVMEIIKLGEKLKYELRHSWLSNGRRESVAEHTWRVALMAVLISPKLSVEINMEKLLKMIIIHDLVEAEAGDIPAFETLNNASIKSKKRENEIKAIMNIRDTLGGEVGEEIYELWMDFEDKASIEAQVANAFDKLEAQIQHNESDISTWLQIEHSMSFRLGRHCEFSQELVILKDLIQDEAEQKLNKAGIEADRLKI